MDKNINIIISAVDKATAPLKRLGTNMSNFADKNKEVFTSMRNVGLVAGGVLVAGISGAVNKAKDLNESMNAVNVVFGEGSELLKEFGKTSAREVGLSARAFNQLATPVGAMLQNLGYGAKEAAQETINLTKRASDMASVFNVDVTEAMGAIQAGLRGEADPLERFGVSLNDASIKAYALKTGLLESTREMTASEKATARLGLLYDQTSKLQGDFANTSGELANSQRIMGAQIENISATIGTAFLPIINQVLQSITPVITKVGEWVQQNPELTKNILLVTLAITGLLTVLGTLGAILPSIITGVRLFSVAIAGIGGPITLLIALIAILVGVVIKNWDTIKWYTVYLVDSVKTKFSEMYDSLKGIFEKVRLVFTVVWEGIKLAVTGIIDSMIDGIKSRFKSIGDFVSNTVSAIGKMGDKVGNIGSGIKTGLSNLISGQRALGGTVQAGKSYLVGERGPEIYTPSTTGRIQNQPSNSMGVNINLGGVVIHNSQDENRLIQKMKVALMEESRKFNLGIVV